MIYNKNITLGFRKCPPPQPWMDTLEYIIILEQFFFVIGNLCPGRSSKVDSDELKACENQVWWLEL